MFKYTAGEGWAGNAVARYRVEVEGDLLKRGRVKRFTERLKLPTFIDQAVVTKLHLSASGDRPVCMLTYILILCVLWYIWI